MVFEYSGPLRIRVNHVRGPNAALSGIFFDGTDGKRFYAEIPGHHFDTVPPQKSESGCHFNIRCKWMNIFISRHARKVVEY
jgi:hypothetical protein